MHIFRRYIDKSNQKTLNLKDIIDNEVSIISNGLELDKNFFISEPDETEIFDLAIDLENYLTKNNKLLVEKN